MQVFSVAETNAHRRRNGDGTKYPANGDRRQVDGLMLPRLFPGFRLEPGQRVFTVGSCFARNIEAQLDGYEVPTRHLELDPSDPLAARRNTVLNEYNPGAMAQRLTRAAEGHSDDQGILPEGNGYSDYFITGSTPAPLDVVSDRRRRIERIYDFLPGADLLIVTLGMTEAWFDRETGLYLNRAPGSDAFRAPEQAGRFEFRVLDAGDCADLLAPALNRVIEAGVSRILLTVSPVPLQRTFSPDDAVIANARSKANLRCAVDLLRERVSAVDYFPSYEMVTTFAGDPFQSDNVHVRPDLVARVTRFMCETYAA